MHSVVPGRGRLSIARSRRTVGWIAPTLSDFRSGRRRHCITLPPPPEMGLGVLTSRHRGAVRPRNLLLGRTAELPMQCRPKGRIRSDASRSRDGAFNARRSQGNSAVKSELPSHFLQSIASNVPAATCRCVRPSCPISRIVSPAGSIEAAKLAAVAY